MTSSHPSLCARSTSIRVAHCPAAKRFPMLEWILLQPSPLFWKLNVALTFPEAAASREELEREKQLWQQQQLQKRRQAEEERRVGDQPEAEQQAAGDDVDFGRFIIVTFQSQSASLSEHAEEYERQSARAGGGGAGGVGGGVREDDTTTKASATSAVALPDAGGGAAASTAMATTTISAGDTMMYSEGVAEWKDLCRENVLAFAKLLRENLAASAGASAAPHFFDTVDPATGMPLQATAGPSMYSESDAVEQLLKMPVVALGVGNSVCRMLQHPVHGLDCYPASLFFVGSRALLLSALADL